MAIDEMRRCVECFHVWAWPAAFCTGVANDRLLCKYCCDAQSHYETETYGHRGLNWPSYDDYLAGTNGTSHICILYDASYAGMGTSIDTYEPVEGLGVVLNWEYCLGQDGVTQYDVGNLVMSRKPLGEGSKRDWWIKDQQASPITADYGTRRLSEPGPFFEGRDRVGKRSRNF